AYRVFKAYKPYIQSLQKNVSCRARCPHRAVTHKRPVIPYQFWFDINVNIHNMGLPIITVHFRNTGIYETQGIFALSCISVTRRDVDIAPYTTPL
ncbi:MAG: hypothetical protein LBN42_00905, partial [Oscillospiraceae bacterium]|nr:hypothetical protein [Oscillospiraceae bacterium]